MRRILCSPCAKNIRPTHPEDAAMGFSQRTTAMLSNGRSIVCDQCGKPIAEGERIVGWTMWQGVELGRWEHEYAMQDGGQKGGKGE